MMKHLIPCLEQEPILAIESYHINQCVALIMVSTGKVDECLDNNKKVRVC